MVDDDKDITSAICTMLEAEFRVSSVRAAYDGNEAIRVFEEFGPNIVVLDMMLPKRSGLLVLQRVGRNNTAEDVAVIMITGNQGARHRAYAESLGVWKYLLKPFPMEELIALVREAARIAGS